MAFLSSEMKILTHDEVRQIHEASIRILESTGMKIEHERMLELLQGIGAKVDFNTKVVKFPRNLVEDCVKKQVNKMNGGESKGEDYIEIGKASPHVPAKSILSTHIFCVNVCDMDTGDIRPALLKDLDDAAIIANELPNVPGIGPLVVPNDVPVELNDAYMWATLLKRSKKRISGELFNLDTIPYIYDMCCAVAGSEEAMKQDPVMMFPCFPTSPFDYSRYALDMAFKVIDLGMPVRFGGSMVVAGFTGPTTLAGTITVSNTEMLASMVMAEAVGGDCFGIMGISISFNQANGTALYASPEKLLISFTNRDIAKFYGFNCWRNLGGHTNGSDACFPGLQAGIEKGISSMLCGFSGNSGGHCGMVSPEVASLPQMIADNEICDFVNRLSMGIKVDEETIACDLIEKLGIHGNYMNPDIEDALDHMAAHFRQENWLPRLFVRERPQQWQKNKKDILQLAKEQVKKILAENDPHPLGEDKEKEIDKILARCVGKYKA